MADVAKTIEIIFAGTDKVSGTIDTVSGQMSEFGDTVYKVAEPLANVADNVLMVDAVLLALAVGGLALATHEAAEFQSAFLEISTLLDDVGESVNEFSDDILNYATNSVKGLDDITSAVYSAISAGTDYQDSLELLKKAEELSIAGRADLESTTVLLASTMNAYGASVDEAGNYSDAFFTIVKEGQTTLPELNTALSKITGLAAAAEIPLEDLGAALAALTASGLPTSEAVTGLKAAISNIIAPTTEAEKAAAALGVNFDASAIATSGLDGVFKELYESTGGNITAMGEFFGSIEGLNTALILGADESGKFADALVAMEENTGATGEAYEKMAESIELTNQKLANNIEVVLIRIGDELLETYGDIAEGVISVLQSIGKEVDEGTFDDFFDLIKSLGEKVSDFLEGIAEAFPEALDKVDFGDLLEELEGLGEFISELFDDFDLTDADDLAEAIQFVVDSLESLVTVTKGMAEVFAPLIESIIETVKGFNNLDEADKESAGNIIAIGKAITDLGIVFAGFLVTLGEHADAIQTTFELVIGSIEFMWDSTVIVVEGILLVIAEFVQDLLTALSYVTFGDWSDSLADAADEMQIFQDSLKEDIAERAEDNLGRLGKAFSSATEDVKGTTEALEEIPEVVETELLLEADSDAAWDEFTAILDDLGLLAEENPVEVEAETKEATEKVKEVIKAVEEIPSETLMEIKLQGEIDTQIAEIEALASTIQNAVEWEAKLDIANVEANAKIIQAAFDALAVTMESTGEVISDIFGAMASLDFSSAASLDIMDKIYTKNGYSIVF